MDQLSLRLLQMQIGRCPEQCLKPVDPDLAQTSAHLTAAGRRRALRRGLGERGRRR